MSADHVVYLDSSAILKLAVREPESAALRAYLRRRRPVVSSALARVEVERALLPLGEVAVRRGREVLEPDRAHPHQRADPVGGRGIEPAELRTLDAIHLATVQQLESDLSRIVTYDDRLVAAARTNGWPTVAPS